MPGRLVAIDIADPTAAAAAAPIDEERRVAVRDLLADNVFSPGQRDDGRFRLAITLDDDRIVLNVTDESGALCDRLDLSLSPLRSTIRDYMIVRESYRNGLARLRPEQIEAIDMGRRGLHDEGAETLKDQLSGRVEVDRETARRLFTLVCALKART